MPFGKHECHVEIRYTTETSCVIHNPMTFSKVRDDEVVRGEQTQAERGKLTINGLGTSRYLIGKIIIATLYGLIQKIWIPTAAVTAQALRPLLERRRVPRRHGIGARGDDGLSGQAVFFVADEYVGVLLEEVCMDEGCYYRHRRDGEDETYSWAEHGGLSVYKR